MIIIKKNGVCFGVGALCCFWSGFEMAHGRNEIVGFAIRGLYIVSDGCFGHGRLAGRFGQDVLATDV